MRAWAEINMENLEHNYRVLRACAPDSKFLGVVKANAYGNGAVPIARKLIELGAEYLGVACLDEAQELRLAGIEAPIIILGVTLREFVPEVVRLNITQTVFSMDMAKEVSDAAIAQGKKAKVHLKVDTGMSRLGVLGHNPEEAAAQLAQICSLPGLEAEGIFTHFANADCDENYTMLQFTRFLDVLDCLKRNYGLTFQIRHCASSAAVLKYPCTHLDMIRPGIALYGHYPDPSCCGLGGSEILPVMSLKCRVVAVRNLPEHTPVSYGCTNGFGDEPGRVAVLSIGYADGIHRLISNRASVWIQGKRRPIIGRICMDMCMIRLEPEDEIQVGDMAELFGMNLPMEEMMELADTIQDEVLCAITPRVKRVYL